MLEHVPHHLQTYEMVTDVVKKNGFCLHFVAPKFLMDESLCDLAIQTNHCHALQFVPAVLKTKARCLSAFALSPESISAIPRQHQTKEMCKKAVEHNPSLLRFCKFKTKELCETAVKQKPSCFQATPTRFRSEELCLWMIEHSSFGLWRLMSYFTPKNFTQAVCQAFLNKSGDSIARFPPVFQTRDLHLTALRKKPESWNKIPTKYRTLELLEAILQEGSLAVLDFFCGLERGSYRWKQFRDYAIRFRDLGGKN
jgi:hypothetical protein